MRKNVRPPVIADPVSHAEKKYHRSFHETEKVCLWEPFARYCTTSQFAALDEGFVRHCGPTALTNLLLTLNGKYGFFPEPAASDVFLDVCRIGRKNLIYWNTDLLRHIGGTYDWFTGRYIRECFRYFGVPYDSLADGIFLGIGKAAREGALTGKTRLRSAAALKVTGHVGTDPDRMAEELKEGRILYLQMHWHPSYRDHHMICYGCRVLTDESGGKKLVYLQIADGWSAGERYLEASDMRLRHYYSIG